LKTSAKIAIVIVVLITIATLILQSGLIPVTPTALEQREDTAQYTPNQNVVIQATTFNGNIEIQTTTGSQIEVTYTIKTPVGHLYDVKISNNETKTDNQTMLITSSENQVDPANTNYIADLALKLPTSCQYNLTLVTSNGDIIKPQLNNAKVAASTLNGDITITDNSASSIVATCMNGDIDIQLAEGTMFQVVASVGNGEITHEGIPIYATVQSTTRLKAATANGEGNLKVEVMTANGNIKLEYINP